MKRLLFVTIVMLFTAVMVVTIAAATYTTGEARTENQGAPVTDAPLVVTGTVVVRDATGFTPLPADARIIVQLTDVSVADGPALVLSEITFTGFVSLPVYFELQADPATINDRLTYSVSARIVDADDHLLFINDRRHQVITMDTGLSTVVELVEIVQKHG